MTTIVANREYIEKLPYTQDRQLQPVSGKDYLTALVKVFGEKSVAKANKLFFGMSDTAYAGAKDFKDRWENSMLYGRQVSVSDQKYIANIVQHYSFGRSFSPFN